MEALEAEVERTMGKSSGCLEKWATLESPSGSISWFGFLHHDGETGGTPLVAVVPVTVGSDFAVVW